MHAQIAYILTAQLELQDLSEIILICWFDVPLSIFFVFSQSHAWFKKGVSKIIFFLFC